MWNPFKTSTEPAPDVLERLRRLESEVAQLRLEWTEVLDKVLHRLQRQAKRDRDALLTDPQASGATNGGGVGVGAPPPLPDASQRRLALYEKARKLGVRR